MAIQADGTGVSNGSVFATTTSWSHTCNGPNPLLVVGIHCDNNATLAVTYNGVSMYNPLNATRLGDGGSTNRQYLFYITGITGTHTISVTSAGSPNVIVGSSMAYSGAAQITGEPDASGNQSATGTAQINDTLTTTLNGSIFAYEIDYTSGSSTAVAPTVRDITNGSTAIFANHGLSAGSNSLSVTPNGFHLIGHVYAAFAAAGGTPVTKLSIGRMKPNAFNSSKRR
jgi:hypothetical protein